jgi:hypothetical protein
MTEPYTPKTELNALAQQMIAQHEARRTKERPRDAVMHELHQAYRGAFATDASDEQNHIAGIVAAHAMAGFLLVGIEQIHASVLALIRSISRCAWV